MISRTSRHEEIGGIANDGSRSFWLTGPRLNILVLFGVFSDDARARPAQESASVSRPFGQDG